MIMTMDEFSFCLLQCADDKEGIRRALLLGANPNKRFGNSETLLHQVIVPEVARALIEHGADVASRDHFGNTPLHLARLPDVARILLQEGASLEMRNNRWQTPLHTVKTVDVAQVLLDFGADIEAKDAYGCCPHEVMYPQTEVAQFLKKRFDDAQFRKSLQRLLKSDVHGKKRLL